jgi:hypothetical protein
VRRADNEEATSLADEARDRVSAVLADLDATITRVRSEAAQELEAVVEELEALRDGL